MTPDTAAASAHHADQQADELRRLFAERQAAQSQSADTHPRGFLPPRPGGYPATGPFGEEREGGA